MAWTDYLLEASFRGVPFKVERASGSGGRRLVKHEFPEKDDAYYEDNGRKNREHPITAYLIGDDYFQQRNDLIDALEKPGVGRLVHPYLDEMDAKCLDYNWTHEKERGRYIEFELSFAFDHAEFLTIIFASGADKLADAKRNFIDKAIDFLADLYEVAYKPVAVVEDLIAGANKALDVVEAAKKVTGTVGEFKNKVDALRGKLIEGVFDLRVIASDFAELIEYGTDPESAVIGDLSRDDFAREQYLGLKSLIEFESEQVSKYPSKVEEEPLNLTGQFQKFVARAALGTRAGLVADMTIDNVSQASDIMNELDDTIRTVEEDETVDDDYYTYARDLRVALDAVIKERKLTLSELTSITLVEFEPAIVTSYRLYGDVDHDFEIVELNEILHPGFLPSSIPLDVQVD